MEFPKTNKIPQGTMDSFKAKVGENAALLQELLDAIQWRKFFNYYCAFFGIVLVSVFLLIAVIRLALWLPL